MKLVPNDTAKKFVKKYQGLIKKFIVENLNGPDKQHLLECLNIRIDLFDEGKDQPGGKITIREDYWNPHIFLYEDVIKASYAGTILYKCTLNQLKLIVLFHELSHLVILLSDVEGNMSFFESDETRYFPEEEDLCNLMAEKYLRENGFLKRIRHVYYQPN